MIEKAVIISLIVTSIYVSMLPTMIFSKIRLFLEKLPLSLHKPLFECLTCMGGIYGATLYVILFGINLTLFPVVLMVIGLNSIINKFFDL